VTLEEFEERILEAVADLIDLLSGVGF